MKRIVLLGTMALVVGAMGCRTDERTARSDAAIAVDVRQELADAQLPGSIEVMVTNGTATLSGTVPDAQTRSRAQDVADNVRGVDRVVNNLRTAAADAPAAGGAGHPGAPLAPQGGAPGMGAYPNEPGAGDRPAPR